MNYKIFNIPIPESNTETEQLNTFINSVKVVSCSKELVHIEKTAFWSFVVEYYKETNATSNGQKKDSVDYHEVLSEEDFAVFAKLRDVRKKLAEQQGVPVYAVFTNEQLAQIVTAKCNSKTKLMQIQGIGEKKVEQYAAAIFEILTTVYQ